MTGSAVVRTLFSPAFPEKFQQPLAVVGRFVKHAVAVVRAVEVQLTAQLFRDLASVLKRKLVIQNALSQITVTADFFHNSQQICCLFCALNVPLTAEHTAKGSFTVRNSMLLQTVRQFSIEHHRAHVISDRRSKLVQDLFLQFSVDSQ